MQNTIKYKTIFRRFVYGGVVCVVFGVSTQAQITLPKIVQSGNVHRVNGALVELSKTPTHAEFAVKRHADEELAKYTILDSVPEATVRASIIAFAKTQLRQFPRVVNFHLQPSGVLGIRADEPEIARRRFEEWLRTPTLSIGDRASTHFVQIVHNIDPESPAKMAVAEQNLMLLRDMGGEVADIATSLHGEFIEAYYIMGWRDSVISHGMQLFDAVMHRQGWKHRVAGLTMYPLTTVVQAIAGSENGAAQIRTLLARYRDGYNVTADDEGTLTESDRKWSVPVRIAYADRIVRSLQLLGNEAPPLKLHVWLNHGTSERKSVPETARLADGKIRILVFGDAFCGSCKDALPILQRLKNEFHNYNIEMVYVTRTTGSWGVDIMTPAAEVQRCQELYVERLNVRFPVAIWAGDKVPTEEGGSKPEDSPTFDEYGVHGTPMFVVVDRKGIVRHMRTGFDRESLQKEMRSTINYLLQEQRSRTTASE